jgi:MFS family permease
MQASKLARVLSYRDFRLLWIGSFLSFTGGWVQNVAQGYFVYKLTGDEAKLALVTFAWSFPVLLFGFIAGSLADAYNKRTVLVVTQALFAAGALYVAAAVYWNFISYWQVLVVSLFLGLVACIEMPTRQSIVSRVVPAEDLAAAVPVNAMTFNVARIFGPALGGLLLAKVGIAACYLLNGLSFIALVWAALAIRSDLGRPEGDPQPIKDLITEGALYTLREPRLRTLLILETITAVFGIYYIALIPAYVEQVLGMVQPTAAKQTIGNAFTATGVGALVGLLLITQLSDSPHKGRIIQGSMLAIGIGLMLLSVVHVPMVAYVLLAIVGGSTIMQFNTTNALFQTLAPERLRGRVLSMHIWALNGFSPFGVLFFGWLASTTRTNLTAPIPYLSTGMSLALQVGSLTMLLGTAWSFWHQRTLANL